MAETDIDIPYYARIKQLVGALLGAKCKGCNKRMGLHATTGFDAAIRDTIDVFISGKPIKVVCKTMKPNPKYAQYAKEKAKYDKKMAEREEAFGEFASFVPMKPKPPAWEPEKIPCKDHWHELEVHGGTKPWKAFKAPEIYEICPEALDGSGIKKYTLLGS